MLCVNSSVPPRRGERFRFPSSQYARYMEGRCDLRKFITELPVAERGAVLSSGRGLLVTGRPVQKIAQRGEMTTARWVRTSPKRISDAKRIDELTMWGASLRGRDEGPTQMDSDQTAAEALQEAETEVGAA